MRYQEFVMCSYFSATTAYLQYKEKKLASQDYYENKHKADFKSLCKLNVNIVIIIHGK